MKQFLLFIFAFSLSLQGWAYFNVNGVDYTIIRLDQVKIGAGDHLDPGFFNRKPAIDPSTSGEFTIPSTVTYNGKIYTVVGINQWAFYKCEKITKVNIPSTVWFMEQFAFAGSGITSIDLPFCAERSAFMDCKNLVTVNFLKGALSIGENAFGGCTNLKTIHLWEGFCNIVTGYTFLDCNNFTEFTVDPKSINFSVVDGVLYSKKQDRLVIYPPGKKETKYTIPSTVTTIDRGAFNTCVNLNTVVIPASVTAIKGQVFLGATNITKLHVNAVDPSRINVKDSYYGDTFFPDIDRTKCTLVVPNGCKSLYQAAGEWGLFGNITEENVSFTVNNITYTIADGKNKLAAVGTGTVKAAISTTTSGTFAVPQVVNYNNDTYSVTAIGPYAFFNCQQINSINLPSTIKSIGREAFFGCILLESFVMPQTETRVEHSLFNGCSNLKSVVLSPLTTNISPNAFSGCSKLASITIPATTTTIEGYAFHNCSGLRTIHANSTNPSGIWLGPDVFLNVPASCTVYVPVGSKAAYMAASQWKNLKIVEEILTASANSTTIGAAEGSIKTISVTSSTSWNAESNQPWLTISPTAGLENGVLTFTAAANPTIQKREATVTLKGFLVNNQTITVTQDAGPATLSVSSNSVVLSKVDNASVTLDVTSNSSWTVAVDQPWLNVNPETNTGDGKLAITAQANNTGVVRSAVVTLSAAGVSNQVINVSQDGSILTLSTNALSIAENEGSTASLNISSNTSWTATSNQSWLTVNPASSSGNGVISFIASANPTIASRNAIVTVCAVGATNKSVVVTQAAGPPTLNVSSNLVNIDYLENSKAIVDVASNTSWSVSSNQAWLTVSPANGSGNAPVTFTAEENYDAQERTATVTISVNGSLSKTVTVVQVVPDNALNFDGFEDYGYTGDNDATITTAFTIETWVNWNATNSSSIQFICGKANEQMELHTGSTANSLRFIPTTGVYLDANNVLPTNSWTHVACVYDAANAVAKMYINGKEVALKNNGPKPVGTALQSTNIGFWLGRRSGAAFFFNGSLDEFRLWNYARSESEIVDNMLSSIDNASTVQGLINYYTFNQGIAGDDNTSYPSLLNNHSATGLLGRVTLVKFCMMGATSNWVRGYRHPDPVGFLNLSNASISIGAEANSSATFDINSSTTVWKVTSDQAWLTISPALGSKNGTVSLTAVGNPTASERTAKVTVFGLGVASKTVTVTQAAGSATLSVSSTTVSIGASENSVASVSVTSDNAWSATSNQSWLTVNPASATGNGTLTFTAQANPTIAKRTARVTVSITPGGGAHYIVVTQDAGPATLSVESNLVNIGHAGNSKAIVYVASNASWSVTSNQAWLTVSPINWTGNTPITFTAAANPGMQERTATVTISVNGSLSQTVTVVQVIPDNALNFDGENDFVEIPDNDASITSAFTIETWVYWSASSSSSVQYICGKTTEQMQLHTGSTPNSLRFIPTTGVYLDANNVLPMNSWTHVACVYDAANAVAKMYINGKEVMLKKSGPNPVGTALQSTDHYFLLGRTVLMTNFFKGSIDEFRLWNYARSESEIVENMLSPIDNANTVQGLVNYYDFNEGIANGDNRASNPTPVLPDKSATASQGNGKLVYFGMIGATSNWVPGYKTPAAYGFLNLSNVSISIGAEADSKATFDINSSTPVWKVTSDQAWLTISPVTGSMNGTITLTAGANPTTSERVAKVTVFALDLASKTITVTQAAGALTFSIVANAKPEGYGTVTGTGTFNNGANVTLNAVPNSNYTFVNWTENGIEVSKEAVYSFTVSSNRTLDANFKLATAINDVTETSTINVYPNPVSSELTIEVKGNNQHLNFEIVSIAGHVISKGKIIDKTTLPMDKLAPGIYILKLVNAGKIEFRKIVKE